MTTDGLPGRPYLLCLFILCILLSMLASMVQEVVDDDDIEKMNQYQAETRWLHIFFGLCFCQLCGFLYRFPSWQSLRFI